MTVSGVVRDSIAHVPLAGAWVQLVPGAATGGSARTVLADSLGRFAIVGVPAGRYLLGFFHPLLDTLGVEAPAREIVVQRRAVRVDLAIPSGDRIHEAICGAPVRKGVAVGALVVGTVRAAMSHEPVANATVTAEWLEYSFQRGLMSRSRPQLTATTSARGWYALCDVPSAGMILLGVAHGGESSDVLEMQVPPERIVRRDLYLGRVRTSVAGDSVRSDSVRTPRRIRTGDGRLTGTVIAADGNRPLAGALVRIADGPMARVNERGEWVITDAPTGTRMLEVRAVGYYAQYRPVDVIANASPVQVKLSTFRAMLDTVKVTAFRVADRHQSGFTERRRSGAGRYLTAEDIERRAPLNVSDLFRGLPGIRIGSAVDTLLNEADITSDTSIAPTVALGLERLVLMRRGAGELCLPDFFIDGQHFRSLSADNLDSFLEPKHLAAVEIYTEATVPIQFQGWRTACGTIVIWTK